jgi:hypothetical protein
MALTVPQPLPAPWTFWAETIINPAPLGPVQVSAFTASRMLSNFGNGSATLPAGSVALPPDRLLSMWSWRLWAHYGGQPVWCGVPTGIADQAAETVSLTFIELGGYLTKRQFDVVGGQVYTQVEQCQIAADLAAPVMDVGISLAVNAASPFLRDRTYGYLEGQSRADLLTNLSQVISGPEFRTEYYVDPASGRPYCRLAIAYPRVGTDTGLGITVPGWGTAYAGKWDTDRLRTRTFAVGDVAQDAPEDTQKPVAIVDRPQAELPRLDAVDDWPSVILVSTLNERANTAAAQYASAVADLGGSVTVMSPPLGTYAPGDDVAIRLTDPLLPGGLATTGRLTQMDIDAAAGTVALTAALTLPPPKPRDTLTARLAAGSAAATAAWHKNLAPLATERDE